MNNSNQLINTIITDLFHPALVKSGINFKSQCGAHFSLIRFDDVSSATHFNTSFKLKFDIKKNGVIYPYRVLVNLSNGEIENHVDLTKGPIQNHSEAISKLIEFVVEFDRVCDSLSFAKRRELRKAIQKIAC